MYKIELLGNYVIDYTETKTFQKRPRSCTKQHSVCCRLFDDMSTVSAKLIKKINKNREQSLAALYQTKASSALPKEGITE